MTTRNPRPSAIHANSPLWEKVDERAQKEVASRKPPKALRDRATRIADLLAEEFPEATCALNFSNPFELIVATILSAQCTDERVNKVTPDLFKKYRTPAEYAAAPPGELEKLIHSTGFYNNKAKAIRAMARSVVDNFDGEIPSEMENLLTLRGAARKTANVVRMHAFGLPGISVDTHLSRITQRLGLTDSTTPEKIEFDIGALLPPERWTHFANSIILHGRKTCKARKPLCGQCALAPHCPSVEEQ
ncbi:MAG: endonuclease III [Candidatus Sumerlaeia bacterium]|nr:endonuclease III [Candidatus Sumerlaeia bacterium]